MRWKSAKESVLAAARSLRCSACEEAKPPGAKPVWAEGLQVGNIDGSRVLELLQERWFFFFFYGCTHYEQILTDRSEMKR